MSTQYKRVSANRKIVLNVLMVVLCAEFVILGAIKGLEGNWLGWFVAVSYLSLGIYATTGKLFHHSAYSGIRNIVLLIALGLAVFSMGMLLLDDVVIL